MQPRDSRLPFNVAVTIKAGDRSVTASTSDISLTGLFARCVEAFPPGTVCDVEVMMPESESQVAIQGRFEVVRKVEGDPSGMGLRFLEPGS